MLGGFCLIGRTVNTPARLVLPEMRLTLFEKIPGGGFELNETQTNPESYAHKTSKLQPKIRQELAESIGLQI